MEPDAPTDEQFEINPFAPQEYEKALLTWAHCHVDARKRVCDWHLERTAAGDIVCSLPKRPE